MVKKRVIDKGQRPSAPVAGGDGTDGTSVPGDDSRVHGVRWEYRTLWGAAETVERRMNELGGDGWEAWGVRAWEGGQTVYMKRVVRVVKGGS